VGNEIGELVGFEALCAMDESTLYAAGWGGELWCLEKNIWQPIDSPTNLILTGLTAISEDEVVYTCGRQGILLQGNKNAWSVVDHAATEEDFWSVAYFRDQVYLSSLQSIYVLVGDSLERVDDGSETGSYYHLSANDDIMISVGAAAILLFDGDEWVELV
jgi:hypothetical protein